MDNSLVYWLDGIDRQLMLILNYDGGVVQDWCWQTCSSRLIWVLPAMYFVYRLFAQQQRWAYAAVLLLGLVLTVTLCDQVSSGQIKPLVGRLRPSHTPALAGQLHLVDGYRGSHWCAYLWHGPRSVLGFATVRGTLCHPAVGGRVQHVPRTRSAGSWQHGTQGGGHLSGGLGTCRTACALHHAGCLLSSCQHFFSPLWSPLVFFA